MIFQRNTGKLCFATLREGDGTELQAMVSLAGVGEEELARWKAEVDLGDHVFVDGEVITSQRGELSVMADRWAMASKAMRPLPVAHRGLNEETRVRQRYVDLIVRPQARDMVRTRAQVVRHPAVDPARPRFRRGRDADAAVAARGCDSSALQDARERARHRSVPADRAGAVPQAHAWSAASSAFSRSTATSATKGIDSTHSPEFAMLEAYQAYGTYDDMAELTHDLVIESVRGRVRFHVVRHADGSEHDLGGQWRHVTLHAASRKRSVGR